jgi:hypothetical protein
VCLLILLRVMWLFRGRIFRCWLWGWCIIFSLGLMGGLVEVCDGGRWEIRYQVY